ncbi:MAG: ABC transporter permease [Prolixibacteraceae bacterium]|jgi:putative ABC transport system permease protein|nr:ABC transporter permease [Prolixibacteraceae bacterium]
MSLTNIRSTFNHLKKNKFHTLLNIFGLAVGLLFFVNIVLYIGYEKGYDTFFPSHNQIYRVNYDIVQNGEQVLHSTKTPRGLFSKLEDEIPEIEYSGIGYIEKVLVRYKDRYYSDQPDLWVEGNFVELFGLKMIRGKATLNQAYTCVISESKAHEIFGNEDPIGKVLLVNEGMRHEITGIFNDLPSNSHIHFDYFMPIRTWVMDGFIPEEGNLSGAAWWTYVKLKKGATAKQVEKSLTLVAEKYLTHLPAQNRKGIFSLQPLSKLHYSSNRDGELGVSTREKTIDALMLIAALILIVVWMNYVNLSTALSRKRLNVFATYRKMGAGKGTLIKMALTESVLINFAALVFAALLYFTTKQPFRKLIGVPISSGEINYKTIVILISSLVIAGTLITALISSIPMLKVNPALMQQRKLSKNSGSQWLVGIQFFTSVFLVLCSLMVSKQIHYMQKAELGVNLNRVMAINGAASTHSDPLRREHFIMFRDEAVQLPGIQNGTASMNVPGQPVRFRNSSLARPDQQSILKQEIPVGLIDDGFIETYDLKLLAGRNFEQPANMDSANVIICESTAKLLDFNSPQEAINRQLRLNNQLFNIKGVVNDFHHEGLKKPSEPMLFTHTHPFEFGYYSFKITGDIKQTLTQLKPIWNKHYPNDPMDYFFSDDYFNQQYNEEMRLSKILTAFTLFAIIVASLGLFGLISFFAQQRTKEIGVRKVNGATVTDIILMVFTYFTRFEIAAFLLACPLAWLLIDKWLQGFAYQTTISWWIFLVTGLIAFIISILSVITQSYKAATKNPVEALRHE